MKRKPSPDYKRLLKTINLEEPDRVPLAEMGIDRPVKEKFLGKPIRDLETEVEFWWKAGYDYIYQRPEYEYTGMPVEVASGTTMANQASGEEKEAQTRSTMHGGIIKNMEALETYPWPDPETINYGNLTKIAHCLPEGMGLISGVGGIFTRTWNLLGYENFCMALYDKPEIVEAIFKRVGEIQCEVLRRVVKMDKVFAIWYGDDLGYTEGLLASPGVLRKHLFPWMEELAHIAHQAGMPFILHSDGKTQDVIPDLIALGLNALQPIEPKAMDIREIKKLYRNKLALFGNVDLKYSLVRGTPQEVREEVRQLIKDLAPGGGYALGSSCSVAHYVPIENFRAMIDATFEFGTYPINL